MMSEESEPFLHIEVEKQKLPSSEPQRSKISQSSLFQIIVHIVLICIYTIISLCWIRNGIRSCRYPANAVDHLTVNTLHGSYDLYDSTKFVGAPGSETDESWNHLLQNRHIRVSKEELFRNHRTSVALPGGGYLAWVGVFHELHCVNLLRQWKHKEYYFVDASQEEMMKIEKHTDHCLDRIRATLMCHPDTASLTTFFWDNEARPKVNGTKTLRECVDWKAMMASLKSRSVHHQEIASLRNPTLL